MTFDVDAPPRQVQPRRSGRSRIALTVLAVAIVWLLAAVTPSPYSINAPGPVVNALGTYPEFGGEAVVTISGTETFTSDGELNVMSIAIYGSPDNRLSWLDVARAFFDARREIVPMTTYYPEGVSVEDRTEVSAILMRSSQQQAVAAALTYLDEELSTRLRIVEVRADGASHGLLLPDDRVLAVAGTAVSTMPELSEAMSSALERASQIVVEVERAGRTVSATIEPKPLEAGGDPLLGITIASEFDFPYDVSMDLGDIGGPSAGLIFALTVVELLTPDTLVGDLVVSGSGTIETDGSIGRIGGLPQKLHAAADVHSDLFLMAIENCEDLPRDIPGDFALAPVANLEEAIAAIELAQAGETPPGRERCE